MELNEINRLIDKYFAGKTTLNEEQTIAYYLANAECLPEEYLAIKAMFEAMGHIRDVKVPKAKPRKSGITLSHIRKVAVVAACIVLGIVITARTMTATPLHAEPMIICYVDGARVDDQKAAEQEMRRILSNMNENVNLAMASIDKVNILKTK